MMKFIEIQSKEHLLTLEEQWKRLYKEASEVSPFLRWEWYKILFDAYGMLQGFKLFTCCADNGELLAIIPLEFQSRSWKKLWVKKIHFIGDTDLADYMSVLVKDENIQVIKGLLKTLMFSRWSILNLKRIPENDTLVPILDALSTKGVKPCLKEVNCISPQIEIKGTWDEYFAGKAKKKLRQEIRTTCNHLDKMGDYKFTYADESNVDEALGALRKFHLQRQKNKVGVSVFDHSEMDNFLTEMARNAVKSGHVNLSMITLDGQIISVAYSHVINDVFYYWIPSFDENYPKLSLGKLHIMHLVQDAFAKGLNKFDFMIGTESYKQKWANVFQENYEYTFCSNSIIATFIKMKKALRSRLKEIKNKNKFLKKLWVKIS